MATLHEAPICSEIGKEIVVLTKKIASLTTGEPAGVNVVILCILKILRILSILLYGLGGLPERAYVVEYYWHRMEGQCAILSRRSEWAERCGNFILPHNQLIMAHKSNPNIWQLWSTRPFCS